MQSLRRVFAVAAVLTGVTAAWTCGFDHTLRAYLYVGTWLPFGKTAANFGNRALRQWKSPFAGMSEATANSPLGELRAAYRQISQPMNEAFDVSACHKLVAAAQADKSLAAKEREEIALIDAKIDIRAGDALDHAPWERAQNKLATFLRSARNPAYLSEARGWLAYVHYLEGHQSIAGKMYLDELNRNDSALSRESLMGSLRLTYRYDGGSTLIQQIGDYFDTPEHAAFALQILTNPHMHNYDWEEDDEPEGLTQAYPKIKQLLSTHKALLRSSELTLLAMRIALRMGDLEEARRVADSAAADSAIQQDPDFLWMQASVRFLSRQYAAAEAPLLALYHSTRATENQKAAAAYGLCGVYMKTGNALERLRYALWLYSKRQGEDAIYMSGRLSDVTMYWAPSGFDLKLMLEYETPLEVLETFIAQNPSAGSIRTVKYALAVRLSREDRYEEAAKLYQSISAIVRAPRMRQLAALNAETKRDDVSELQRQQARYNFAKFLGDSPNRIYFNDSIWHGYQTYALIAESDSTLTAAERKSAIEGERKLKDDQEELWRAAMIASEIARTASDKAMARKSALLAIDCLQRMSERFGRPKEIRQAANEMLAVLRR